MNFSYKVVILALFVGAVAMWFVVGRLESRNAPPQVEITHEVTRETIYDTIYYHNIEPITVTYEEELPPTDSLYIFRDTLDSRWSAEITGSNITLRNLTLYDREEHIHTTSYIEPRWDVSLRGGVDPYVQWVGVGVSRTFGRATVTLSGGYDLRHRSPYVGAMVSFSIWRE